MIFDWLKRRRREKLAGTPFPAQWIAFAERIAAYRILNDDERRKLEQDVQIFVAEKNWEGCSGLTINDEIRVTIACYACLMVLELDVSAFDRVLSILVYPSAYAAPWRDPETGRIMPGEDHRLGEAWYRGPVVLSWADILHDRDRPGRGRNLVWHEFAHQLDMLDRASDGTPPLETRDQYRRWTEIMTSEFERLKVESHAGEATLLDNYGTQNETEFFSIATECFFDRPIELAKRHPDLYALLCEYYRQDPAQRERRRIA